MGRPTCHHAALFGDLLPESVITRQGKAEFSEPLYATATKRFAISGTVTPDPRRISCKRRSCARSGDRDSPTVCRRCSFRPHGSPATTPGPIDDHACGSRQAGLELLRRSGHCGSDYPVRDPRRAVDRAEGAGLRGAPVRRRRRPLLPGHRLARQVQDRARAEELLVDSGFIRIDRDEPGLGPAPKYARTFAVRATAPSSICIGGSPARPRLPDRCGRR